MVEKTSVYPGGTRLDAAAKSAVRPLSPLSEDEVLALIDRLFPSRTGHVPDGRGDDCAELALAGSGPVKGGDLTSPRLALSTDLFLEDVHFSFGYCTPEEVGAKALAAAVSDLAAAGAVPLGFSLGLILPPALALAGLNSLLKGMAAQAASFDMALSGGDLIRGEKLGLSVTVWGRPPDAGTPFLRRGGVRAGHCIFLIGDAGLARVGLWALQREGRQALASWPSACAAHLGAKPLLAQGQAIARLVRYEADAKKNGDASARVSLMDVSDGLARDLPRLLGGLGADLDFDAAIIPP
ncbi:MAG: hypothetical protein LBH65_01385, partial [Desulfovibrio sp.]|nr:hypothetical protein [Desulfovibrio sp.]